MQSKKLCRQEHKETKNNNELDNKSNTVQQIGEMEHLEETKQHASHNEQGCSAKCESHVPEKAVSHP